MMSKSKLDGRIEFENNLAMAMLQEAVNSSQIKALLQHLADQIKTVTLNPLMKMSAEKDSFSSLCKKYKSYGYKEAITKLAIYQSNEGKQFGATMRYKYETYQQVTTDMMHVRDLITTLDKTLTNIPAISNVIGIVKVLKLLVDLGMVYMNGLVWPEHHTQRFLKLNQQIFSSRRENLSRIMRKELGLAEVYATSLGIRRENFILKNKIDANNKKVMQSGKAIFWGVSTEKRLELISYQYQLKYLARDFSAMRELEQMACDVYGEEIANIICNHQLEQKINFQALAQKVMPDVEWISLQKDLPMISTCSGSLARPIIALMMIRGFSNPRYGSIADQMQIFANCMAAFLTLAGHHSITEGAETYNKALRYLCDEKGVSKTEVGNYFYRYGEYETFLHAGYRLAVIRRMAMSVINNCKSRARKQASQVLRSN